MEKRIELDGLIHRKESALVGPANGEALLQRMREAGLVMEDLEQQFDRITFVIPERIVSMNKSFFLAVWAERVQALGKDAFLEKYAFETSPHISRKIISHIDVATLTATQDAILDV
jgi:hypothetical protein